VSLKPFDAFVEGVREIPKYLQVLATLPVLEACFISCLRRLSSCWYQACSQPYLPPGYPLLGDLHAVALLSEFYAVEKLATRAGFEPATMGRDLLNHPSSTPQFSRRC
jgi:hypothetical protein